MANANNLAVTDMIAKQLRPGMTLMHPYDKVWVQVTHVRKSRTFRGYYAVQFTPADNHGSFAIDLQWNREVFVAE